jgi:hypothetical protein
VDNLGLSMKHSALKRQLLTQSRNARNEKQTLTETFSSNHSPGTRRKIFNNDLGQFGKVAIRR